MKKIVSATSAPKAVGPYSHAIDANGTLYVSGQLPIDPSTGQMPEGVVRQTEQSLANLGAILREAGYGFHDVVKATVLLSDMNDFGAMNEVYAHCFGDWKPARICYEVGKLPMGALVEIDAIASK